MARLLAKAAARLKKIGKRRILGGALIVLSLGLALAVYGRLYVKRWVGAAEVERRRTAQSTPAAFTADQTPTRSPIDEASVTVSTHFGLVVPSLGINVPVIQNVSGIEGKEYFTQLKRGVAHQEGTATPNAGGNTVIFGHSSTVPGVSPSPYDEVFLMLDQLQPDDRINVYYNSKQYTYIVTSLRRVAAGDLHILDDTEAAQLTLYTCWPPGTDAQRLVVTARPTSDNS